MSVCLTGMRYYTVHPIAMKLWSIVVRTSGKISVKKYLRKNSNFEGLTRTPCVGLPTSKPPVFCAPCFQSPKIQGPAEN